LAQHKVRYNGSGLNTMFKTKIKPFTSISRILALLALGLLIFLSAINPLQAQTVTTGYGADIRMQRGMIVQLKKSDTTKVEPVTAETNEEMHGVVVDPNDAPVTISSEGQKVFVATTGHFQVLVSSQAGDILPGDYITVSAIHGIGMKAGDQDPLIVGRALEAFDSQSLQVGTSTIDNSDGSKTEVRLGRISTDIGVSRNPLLKGEEPNLPEFLRKATEAIAGEPVNPVRAYLSVVVFLIGGFIAGSILFSGIRSSIIAIGRNPLSKKSIIKGLLQVILTGLIIFITTLIGVYLLLKL
jgi:hypothetical protein